MVASHADILRGSSRVLTGMKTLDEPLRTSAWEAIPVVAEICSGEAESFAQIL